MTKYSATRNPKSKIIGLLAFAAISTFPFEVHADAIDGNWCNKKGQHININGPRIKTPEGANIVGNYDRHSFSYKSTSSGEHANKNIRMQLLSDDLMQMTLPDGVIQDWRRCEIVS